MQPLYDNLSRPIRIGREIGRGGEGKVCELLDGPRTFLAKLYHKSPSPAKEEKLRAMVRLSDQQLSAVSAWPVSTIHMGQQGPVAGVVIPRIEGYAEIHSLYSPAQRNREFPDADFAFLVRTAANTARTFETVHRKNQVIGDVNQNNVLVHKNATVFLIDADSFQVVENGTTHRCEVGVATFTPPELQGKKFSQVDRIANHDRFGLAVLIFHLLFLGRHPFAGSPLDGELTLEKAIHEGRFAYGSNAAAKKIAAPPGTLPLHFASSEVARLFELAFQYSGTPPVRPTAADWVSALEGLESGIRTCSVQSGHRIPKHLTNCPWCQLVAAGQPDFFAVATFKRSGGTSIDLTLDVDVLWAKISRFQWPNFGELTSIQRPKRLLQPAACPYQVPPPLAPFIPTPEPRWHAIPPKPPEPQLLAIQPPVLLVPKLKQVLMPKTPQRVEVGSLPPPVLPQMPEARRLPRMLPQRLAGGAAFGGFLCALVFALIATPLALGGLTMGVVFSGWWLVLETRRGAEWQADLQERLELWQSECAEIKTRWQEDKARMEADAARENARRQKSWQNEVDRRRALVDRENKKIADNCYRENARRRQEWEKRNSSDLAENEKRMAAWRGLVERWCRDRDRVNQANQELRSDWEIENRPARQKWEAAHRRRKAAIELVRLEHAKRQNALAQILSSVGDFEQKWRKAIEAKREEFDRVRSQLETARNECVALRTKYRRELEERGALTKNAQQKHYLDQFVIKKGIIKGLGEGRIDVLASFGIETAADVEDLDTKNPPGFGPKFKGDLYHWRDSLLRGFRPNLSSALPPSELAILNGRYGLRIGILDKQLQSGEGALQAVVDGTKESLNQIWLEYDARQTELEQAQVDLEETYRLTNRISISTERRSRD